MIPTDEVQNFLKQAQKAEAAGLHGIFGQTDLECEFLWRYVEECSETCVDVVMNTPQSEVIFRNGVRVRVFCASWRTHIGMRFEDVLLSDESIREHVYSQILYTPPKPAPEPPLKFGL